jgi:toxin ParE1/3/4
MKIVWSARSQKDLSDIAEYIAHDSVSRALSFVDKIAAKATRLSRFPGSGRVVPEFHDWADPLREIIIDDYRLVYRVHHRRIEIVTVFHGAKRFFMS